MVHNGNVPIPPFDIRPAVLEIAKDDTVVMDIVFQPPQVKSYSVDMCMVCDNCNVKHFSIKGNSTANIKDLRGSLGALSVNKLSHIPKLQPILRFMKTNDVAFGPVYLSSYLPLKYPTHYLSLRSDNYAKRINN